MAQRLMPSDYAGLMPETFFLAEDYQKLEDRLMAEEATYIAKPSKGFGGNGIVLMQRVLDMPTSSQMKDMVCQQYVGNPLLIDR